MAFLAVLGGPGCSLLFEPAASDGDARSKSDAASRRGDAALIADSGQGDSGGDVGDAQASCPVLVGVDYLFPFDGNLVSTVDGLAMTQVGQLSYANSADPSCGMHLRFDDGHAVLPHDPSVFPSATTEVEIKLRVRTTAVVDRAAILVKDKTGTNDGDFGIHQTVESDAPYRTRLVLRIQDTSDIWLCGPVVDPNTWHEVRLVMGDSGVTFEVDGVGASASGTQIIFSANNPGTPTDDALKTCAPGYFGAFGIGNNTNAWIVGASNETGDGGAAETGKPFSTGAVDQLSIWIQ